MSILLWIVEHWRMALGLALSAVLTIALWYAHHQGYKTATVAQQAAQIKKDYQQVSKLTEVKDAQQAVAAHAPRTRSDVIARLRDGTF